MTSSSDRCPDCDVGLGKFHKTGCDIDQCPYCGRQLISCRCRRTPPLDDRMPWMGVWPGVAECHEFGWFARLVPGKGWVPCKSDEPGAVADLNRLHMEARWDRGRKRFVLGQE
jgi:hypothetical protein